MNSNYTFTDIPIDQPENTEEDAPDVLCTIYACNRLARWCITGGIWSTPVYACQKHLMTYLGTYGVYKVESFG